MRAKYGNTKTIVDGVSFDSKKEANRASMLAILERAGEIRDLRRQVRFPLHVAGNRIGHIIPDFVYERNGKMVCEDVKSVGTITPMFRWKAKHFFYEYGIPIEVIL